MDKIQLEKQLNYHDNLYYNKDNPEISDAEYDALKDTYVKLYGEYNYVPGEAQFKKYTHQFPIKSLSKVNNENDLRKELIRLTPGIIEYKYDGLTLVYYPDGAIVSRGNSLIGENLRDTATRVLNLPKISQEDSKIILDGLPIRLEAFMTKKSFEKLNKEREEQGLELFSNARNAVAGILRNKEIKNVKGISYRAYNIVGSDESEEDQLEILKDLGFKVDDWFYYDKNGIEEAIEYIKNINRDELEFEIDGMVIKSNKQNSLKLFGETEHHPKNACSYKFPNFGKWSILKSITWQTGRTGRITPVAEIEPVEILGSIIERATLHNIGYIKALDLQLFDKIYVVKNNDVIPGVIKCEHNENSVPIKIINKCPSCGFDLITINDQLFCGNNDCQAKLLFRTKHLASRDALNIENLNEQTIQKFIYKGYINKPWDVFNITIEQILKCDGFAKKSAEKLYKNIQNARNCDFNRAIYATGIELIGKKVSKDIAKEFKSYENLLESFKKGDLGSRLSNINGIGDNIISSFISNLGDLNTLVGYLDINKIEKKKESMNYKSLDNVTFVVTGKVETFKNRKELESLITSLNGKLSSAVSSKTNFLINNNITSTTGKNKKAMELGVEIISETMFNEMIGRGYIYADGIVVDIFDNCK